MLNLAFVTTLLLASSAPQAPQTIAGRVVTDGNNPQPVRHASVHVQKLDTGLKADVPERIAVTDDAGMFSFDALPPGRYTVWTTKNAWASSWYGSKRPGDPTGAMSILVAQGQAIKPLTLSLSRGAVVTGMLRDQNGEPLPGARASVLQARLNFQTGASALVSVNTLDQGVADNRGVYRIYGLAPGTYVVMSEYVAPPFRLPSEAEWKWAEAAPTSPSSNIPVPDAGRPRRYTPIYYPGTALQTNATPITLAAGDERSGVDITITPVAVASITGTVQLTESGSIRDVTIAVMDSTGRQVGASRPNDSGVFTLVNMVPGSYTVMARSIPASTAKFWASAEVNVDGSDQSVALALQPAMQVTGRVTFISDKIPPPQDLTRVRIALVSVALAAGSNQMPTAMSNAAGEFVVIGVVPGRYRVIASISGGGTNAAWTAASAMAGTRDVIDLPLDVSPDSRAEIAVTFTDTVTALAGTLVDASGRPAPDYFVIAFPASESLWSIGSRRIAAARPGVDGKYRVTLPPGDYLVAAVTDVEQFQWFDDKFLRELKPYGVRIALADDQVATQDLKIGGGLATSIPGTNAGVIDPTKVVRSALQNAASISPLLLTTGASRSRERTSSASEPGERSRDLPGRNVLRRSTAYAKATAVRRSFTRRRKGHSHEKRPGW